MIFSLVLSLVLGLVVGQIMIPLLTRAKFGQEVRLDGPQSHLKKQGTPTMGGILFFFAIGIGMLVSGTSCNNVFFMLFTAFAFGATGLIDDSLKLIKKESEGLTPKQKLFAQFLVALIVSVWAIYGLGLSTKLWVPLFNIVVPLGYAYFPFIIFLMLGTTNACNLTDGIDGLLSSVSLVVFGGYFLISFWLDLPASMSFAISMIGGLLAFLYYNRYPAKVFMGDTGSFFIGGAVVAMAIITKTELLLVFLGMTFVIEALSDIIQVLVYKKTKRRVFKMAPIHHHFEALGYSENKVVLLFAIFTLAFVLIGLALVYGVDFTMLYDLMGENYVQ